MVMTLESRAKRFFIASMLGLSALVSRDVVSQEDKPLLSFLRDDLRITSAKDGCSEGVCGTCVIEVVEGMDNLSDFTQEERDFLGDQNCERLACQCKLKGGCVKIKF